MHARRTVLMRWLVLMFAVAFVVSPAPSRATGFFAHKYITQEAWKSFPEPSIRQLLATHRDVVLLGSLLPDTYFQTTLDADLTELTHDTHAPDAQFTHPFQQAFLSHIRSDSMSRDERLDRIAFLFGVIAHHAADSRFDAGLLKAAESGATSDIACPLEALAGIADWLKQHSFVDLSFDWCVSQTYGEVGIASPYLFPLDFNLGVYWTLGRDSLTRDDLSRKYWGPEWYFGLTIPMYWANGFVDRLGIMEESARSHCGRSTVLESNYNWRDNPNGGLTDLIEWVSNEWLLFLAQERVTTALTLTPPRPDEADGRYRQPVTVSVTPSKGFGELESFCSLDRGFYAPVTTPIEISTQGSHTLSCYSIDVTGIAGETKSAAFTIDLTPPEAPKESGGCSTGGGAGASPLLALLAFSAPLRRRRACLR